MNNDTERKHYARSVSLYLPIEVEEMLDELHRELERTRSHVAARAITELHERLIKSQLEEKE